MVERFNRTLLQLLRSYVTLHGDWETHLPHVLYAYRTSYHTTTGASPYLLLYGREPPTFQRKKQLAFDPHAYSAKIQAKLAELQDFVHTNIALANRNQKLYMTNTQAPRHLNKENLFGSPFQWQANWILDGRGMGCKISEESYQY